MGFSGFSHLITLVSFQKKLVEIFQRVQNKLSANNIQQYTKKFQTNITTRHFSGFQICRGKKNRDQFVRFFHHPPNHPLSKFLLPKTSCLHIRQKIASGAKMFPQDGQTSAQQRVEKFCGSQNHTTPGTPVMSGGMTGRKAKLCFLPQFPIKIIYTTTCKPRSSAREFTRKVRILAFGVVVSSHRLAKLQYLSSNCFKPPRTTSTLFANRNIQCDSILQTCFYVPKQL